MKAIFYILSILVIAAAAFFGYTNSNKIKNEIGKYQTARDTLVQVNNNIDKTQGELDDTEAALTAAKSKNADLTAKLENEQSKEGQMRRTLDTHQRDIEEQDKRLTDLAEIQAQIQAALEGVEIPWEQIPSKIQELQDQRKSKGDDLQQLIKLTDKLASEVETKQTELAEQSERFANMQAKIALNARTGRITAVNGTWGFVVVNLGEKNSNVTPESELLVTRGGRFIGRLKPTSVEPTQTICDLNVRELTPGVRIQVGDRVTLAEAVGN